MTDQPKTPCPTPARHGAARRRDGRRGRARGGIRDRRDAAQSGRRGVPAGRRARAAARAARARRGRGARHRVRSEAAARACLRGCRRQAAHARATSRARPCCSTCGPPGACRAARRCRRSMRCRPSSASDNSRWSRSTSTRATSDKPKAWLSEVGIARLGYYSRSEREGVPGSQSRRQGDRHADDAADRSERLRARHARGSGRMGERGRRQADRDGARQDLKNSDAHQGGFGQAGVEPITRAKRSLMSGGTLAAISSRCALVEIAGAHQPFDRIDHARIDRCGAEHRRPPPSPSAWRRR